MSIQRILIAEDDADIRGLVRALLEREGMEVVEAGDGREALRRFYGVRPDALILDVAMPELDGWSVLERVRELSDVPVIMLTSTSDELSKVRGLRQGADDYVTKPFGRQELLARVETALRRGRTADRAEEPVVQSDELVEIDFAQRQAKVRDEPVSLTPTEFRLLTAFVRHPGQVLSQDQLLEQVWSDPGSTSPQQVKLYVGYLRRKLRDAADVDPIETVRGFGYRYRPAAAAE